MYPPLTAENQEDLALIESESDLPVLAEIEAEAEREENTAKELEKEEKDVLKAIIFNFEKREQPVRERMLRFFRKGELFWDGVQDIIWDEVARDFKSVRQIQETDRDSQLDPYYYNKIINIFRAYGEAVIAALTPETPTVIFPPDDADVIDDINASKGYTRLSELIAKHNNMQMLLCKAIFTLWNQGLVGSYSHVKTSENYGTYSKPKIEDVESIEQSPICPSCGSPNIMPDSSGMGIVCSDCNSINPAPELIENKIQVPEIVGYEDIPKSRVCIEIFGPSEFEIPHWVKDPKYTPYISLKCDVHVSQAQEEYEEYVGKITASYSDYDGDDRWAREHTTYANDATENEQVTIRKVWLRSWTFNEIKESQPEVYARLREKYPNGVKVEVVDEQVAKCTPENMDDYWSFTKSPLSTHLHALPLGAPLIPLQEIKNEMLLLKLQHVEYGIPETFADPHSLNFKTYSKNQAKPGMIYPAKAMAGKSLEQSFATLKTAQYPKEINDFEAEIDANSQFVVGAFPTIYGGALTGGGKTAAEYNMSRNQALQRLGTTWKIVTNWYAELMGRSVVLFHENMQEDEKYIRKNGDRFETVWIRKADLVGRVGQVEPEISNNFPTSQAQKRDLLIQLLQLNSDAINAAVFASENTTIVSNLLGFPEFYIPGSDDRSKQLEEIQELLLGEPLDFEGNIPSVQVDPILDNHQLELETGLAWMKSDVGRDARVNNPPGYANVRAHILMHQFYAAQQAMMEQENEDGSGSDDGNSSDADSSGQESASD